MQTEINGKSVELSEAGWLLDVEAWDEDIARLIAENENVELSSEHWEVVREARAYYEEYGTVASPRVFSKILAEKYGAERGSSAYIYNLFPYGLVKSANKIAGLPRPKGCS